MSDISNTQISLMVDIGQKSPLTLNPEKWLVLEAPITASFVTPSDEDDASIAPYELTVKVPNAKQALMKRSSYYFARSGQARRALDRGVGLNEA